MRAKNEPIASGLELIFLLFFKGVNDLSFIILKKKKTC